MVNEHVSDANRFHQINNCIRQRKRNAVSGVLACWISGSSWRMIKWPGLRVILKRTYPVGSLKSLIRPWSCTPLQYSMEPLGMRIGNISAFRRQSLDSTWVLHFGYWDQWTDAEIKQGLKSFNNRATGIILHHPCSCECTKNKYSLDDWCLAVRHHEVRRNVAWQPEWCCCALIISVSLHIAIWALHCTVYWVPWVLPTTIADACSSMQSDAEKFAARFSSSVSSVIPQSK